MVNGWSADALNVYDQLGYTPETTEEWRVYRNPTHSNISGYYQPSGLLTDVVWLNTYNYTNTNLNRVRARMVYKQFLDFDVMTLSDRSPSNKDFPNPTLENPDCKICHSIIDPVASLFLERTNFASYNPRASLKRDTLWPAGFEKTEFVDNGSDPLRFLADQLVNDPRFLPAQAHIIYRGLMGKDVLRAESEPSEKALAAQDNFFNQVAAEMKTDNLNIKTAVKAIVKSPYFRAESITDTAEWAAHSNTGSVRLLAPDLMQAKTQVLLGAPWTNNSNPDLGEDQWHLLTGIYGSPISAEIGDSPYSSAANIMMQEQFAADMACRIVPREFFNQSPNTRKLFKQVGLDTVPLDSAGTAIPVDKAKIVANIQYLYGYLLGEDLGANDAQVKEAYDLWLQTWQSGKADLDAGKVSINSPCQIKVAPVTKAALPQTQQLLNDPDYVMRSWMAVLVYLLSDYRFFYE